MWCLGSANSSLKFNLEKLLMFEPKVIEPNISNYKHDLTINN